MDIKEKAKLVAERIHTRHTYNIFPYMYHIQQVVLIASRLGYDDTIIAGCYLHDGMEDGDLSYNDIKDVFGYDVAEIVYAVTDELGRNRKERKARTYPKIAANYQATIVKICDRIANVTESKVHSPKLYKIYKEEHPTFMKLLKLDSHPEEVNKAWVQLEALFIEAN